MRRWGERCKGGEGGVGRSRRGAVKKWRGGGVEGSCLSRTTVPSSAIVTPDEEVDERRQTRLIQFNSNMSRRFVSSSYQSFSQSRRRPHAPVLATVRLAPRSTVPFLPLNPSHPPLLRPPLMLSPTATGKARAPIEVITIEDSDDEVEAHGGDEEMERAIAMSLASARAEGVKLPSTSADTSAAGSKKRDASGSAVRDQGVGGSAGGGSAPREETRAEMEAARQARVRQREEAGLSNAPAYAVRAAVKRPRVGTINDIPDEGASTSSSSASGSRGFHSGGTGSDASTSTARKEERFWQGAIRRVSNKFVPTAADSFSFNEIVDAKGEELERAFVSSMCYEPEWILDQFPNNAPLLLVNPHRKGAPDQRGVQAVPGRSNTALVFATDRSWPTPWPNSHFTMHVKAVVVRPSSVPSSHITDPSLISALLQGLLSNHHPHSQSHEL